MIKTKIDWADSTWNPVTGCLHGCTYCYAAIMAHRFEGFYSPELGRNDKVIGGLLFDLEEPLKYKEKSGKIKNAPYPYGFAPTFHRYRLGDYEQKKGRTIFVVSMGDLFCEVIPDEWIKRVFDACAAAPQHRYLFLTKNPSRYIDLVEKSLLPAGDNYWYGTTVTNSADFIPPCRAQQLAALTGYNRFLSVEPLLGEIHGIALENLCKFGWVIVGAESGKNNDKVSPDREWVDAIQRVCEREKTPLFMKNSLIEIMGGNVKRQFPWEVR